MRLPHLICLPPERLWAFLAAVILYSALSAPFFGQWDSFDYLRQIETHRLSALGFGRPVFIFYNAVVLGMAGKLLDLPPEQAGYLIQAVTLLLGAVGLLLFARLISQLLSPRVAGIALAGMLLSPLYAFYSGSVMTEVPMLVATVAGANLLFPAGGRRFLLRVALSGISFGAAAGIREQALTLTGAFLWLLWVLPSDRSAKVRCLLVWSIWAATTAVAPIALSCLSEPDTFASRIETWFRVIPTAGLHFGQNLSASLLYALLLCPASWLALAGAAVTHHSRPSIPCQSLTGAEAEPASRQHGPRLSPVSWAVGAALSIGLPMAVLWRDADVQFHPRYLLVVLPGVLILCAGLYQLWRPSSRAAVAWALLHVLLFGVAAAAIRPFRRAQYEKRAYAQLVRDLVPGPALLVAGSYSPVFEFYRASGIRPAWRILWSGWEWERGAAEKEIRSAWSRGEYVYLCDGPYAWLYLEYERLDLFRVFRDRRAEVLAPGLKRF